MKEITILSAAHVNQISDQDTSYGPPIALVEYLRQNVPKSASIQHPFSWSHPSGSRIEVFLDRRTQRAIVIPKLNLPEALSYLKDLVIDVLAPVVLRMRIRLYVGSDGINALAGLILRRFGFVEVVAYYSIDYTPKRFQHRLLNAAYHALDRFCVRRSDYVWNLTSRMVNVRRAQGLEDSRNLLIPVGTNLDRRNPLLGKDQRSIVFLSHLIRSKGVELVLDAMRLIHRKTPDVKLTIIGDGPSALAMKGMAGKMGLEKSTLFLGPMNHASVLAILPSFAVGLAPYLPSPDNIAWYADPTKVKDYLSCGLPMVITDVPEVAAEVAKKGAGLMVPYSAEHVADAVTKLLGSNDLEVFQKNAYSMAHAYEWTKLFSQTIQLSKINVSN